MSACEDCGAESEVTGGWSKPSGTAGHSTSFTQSIPRADHVLGHAGYLCTRCWWRRKIKGRTPVADDATT